MKANGVFKKQHVKNTKITEKIVVLCFATFLSASAFTNPTVNNVAAGRVTIQQRPNSTIVNQASQKAIINWRNFNIGKNESTHFQQPAGGVALNRISPLDGVSQIYGRLTATGKIILINPAGIYFGPTAFVKVGGILATTHDIADKDFLHGNYQFNSVSGYSGAIVNEGRIMATNNGLVALVAPSVVNKGRIEAQLGHVVLASGGAFTMNFTGDGLINFAITGKTKSPGVDKDGNVLRDGVRNTGSLIADGGKVIVSAQAASGVLDNVINMQGVAQARSVSQKNGEIIFSGDPDSGIVRVAANVNASGKRPGEKGGQVKITGHQILVDSPTVIDVSGDRGGGNIYIGGNYKGEGPLPNSKATVVMPNTKLIADAVTYGRGGNVILWSDDVTRAYGKISAKGGAKGGDGGFVETSSHGYLDVAGIEVNTSAPKGERGSWLLDPRNVFITTAATTGGSFLGGNPDIFLPTSDDSNVSNTDIMNNLALTDVTITTGFDGSQQGNISVDAPITWTSSNILSLDASNKIFINADITGPNGGLEVTTNAGIPESITSGTAASPNPLGVIANIDVDYFKIWRGEWYQNNPDLPTFNVANSFNIERFGSINGEYSARFTRMAGGDGGATPYRIADKYGLQGVATLPLTNNYDLINNIDLSGTSNWNVDFTGATPSGFLPISPRSRNNSFAYQGTFDGQNHVISNLTLTNTLGFFAFSEAGLFPNLGPTASVSNLGLINVNISSNMLGGALVGALAGQNSGTINNVYVIGGTVTASTADSVIGGLVGSNLLGTISNALADVDVSYTALTAISSNDNAIGGLVGRNANATINDSYSLGSVTVTNPSSVGVNVGGFAGINQSAPNPTRINRSYSSAVVSAPIDPNNVIGGFVGLHADSNARITSSFWDTDVSTQADGFGFNFIGGSITVIGGCFTGTCTILPSLRSSNPGAPVNLSTATTYSGQGWSISAAPNTGSTWNIVNGQMYPFLSSQSSAVSGNTGVLAVNPVQLAAYGTNIQTLTTDSSGTFYGVVPFGQLVLAYSPGSTGAIGNTFFSVGQGNNPTGNPITLSPNAVSFDTTLPLSTNDIAITTGNLSSGLLYSVSGPDLTFNNNINFISSNAFDLNGDITTSGSGVISFLDAVTMSADAVLTTDSGNISFSQGITGGRNLSLASQSGNFSISGPLDLQQVTVTGGGNNQLALLTSDNQTWRITGTNVGDISNLSGVGGFTFTDINNLQGGSGSNSYIFSDQARLLGSIIGGTNSNATHTINFSAYLTPVRVLLNNNIFSGSSFTGSTSITDYSVINNLIGNSAFTNTLTFPNKTNSLVITGPLQGYINDPLFFSGFNTFISISGRDSVVFPSSAVLAPGSSNEVLVNGTPMFFSNFNLDFLVPTPSPTPTVVLTTDIANIMQADSGSASGFTDSTTWSTTTVGKNVDEILKEVADLYDTKGDKIEINPFCGSV
jgi:filamentous hemagglutinin family protein